VDRSGLEVPRIFDEIQRLGRVEDAEMQRVFNMGVGMILVVEAERTGELLDQLASGPVAAADLGVLVEGERGVEVR
jgi:phosphoribosylformylglycinamidine cyclo-ligase